MGGEGGGKSEGYGATTGFHNRSQLTFDAGQAINLLVLKLVDALEKKNPSPTGEMHHIN